MTTIYHIPGVKIGSTYRDPAIRVAEQGYSTFEVLEVHEDESIAAKREIELQKQYGYTLDRHSRLHTVYVAGVAARTPEARKKAGTKQSEFMAGNKFAQGKKNKLGKYSKIVYVELTSGFIGSHTEMLKRFNTRDVAYYAKKGAPVSKGPLTGLHFQIYQK